MKDPDASKRRDLSVWRSLKHRRTVIIFCEGIPALYYAGGGGRTRTVSLPPDFESGTSANSITPAYRCTTDRLYHIISKNARGYLRFFCFGRAFFKIHFRNSSKKRNPHKNIVWRHLIHMKIQVKYL